MLQLRATASVTQHGLVLVLDPCHASYDGTGGLA